MAGMIRVVPRKGSDRGQGAGPPASCRRQPGAASLSPLPGPPPILRLVKLLVAIVHTEDAGHLVDGLLEREFRATRLHSSGGFLKQSNATVILGVEDDQVDAALAVIRENCHSDRKSVV